MSNGIVYKLFYNFITDGDLEILQHVAILSRYCVKLLSISFSIKTVV